ncbi:MAG: TrmB family transcriptional regulator [Candidatus Verstraetearchaeota archaeon]|nr:TrmB family transcriptional regulator [Candidatus Verstraetearchaeota archaeon]
MKKIKSMSAFERLKEIGLSDYEALVYLKLVIDGPSTAKEISESTEVPYTKVYEVLEGLERKGWIEISQGRPMRFKAKSPSEIVEIIKNEYQTRLNKIEDFLINELQSVYDVHSAEESEIWILKSPLGIMNKIRNMIKTFNKELYIVIGNFDVNIYSDVINEIERIDVNKNIKILLNENTFNFFSSTHKDNVIIKKALITIPFNVILSDREEVLFHLTIGLDKTSEERKNLAVHILDKSLAKVIREYIEFFWKIS